MKKAGEMEDNILRFRQQFGLKKKTKCKNKWKFPYMGDILSVQKKISIWLSILRWLLIFNFAMYI